MDVEERPLKLYFIPYLLTGHVIPSYEIAKLFTSRGHHVTIITTPFNAKNLHKSGDPFLHIHTVDYPSNETGLPDGIDSIVSINSRLQPPIEHFVEQHPPDCIVTDHIFTWVFDMANKLRIPPIAFNGFSLFAICAIHSAKSHPIDSDTAGSFIITGLPHPISIKATPPEPLNSALKSLMDIEQKSYGLIVNNFAELDGEEYIEHYQKISGHKVWHLGPASLFCRTDHENATRGEADAVRAHECLNWLDLKPANSVVYICFGSVCRLYDKQLYEIASAIEASGHEFIWVVSEKKGKEEENEEEKEKWLPKGFEERNAKKGMLIRGWAPQVLILDHPAVGAFITHCGWNSTMEAISAGVPMITWPVHGEQFYNEHLITQVRGIGVEVGAEEWSIHGFRERKKLVSRDKIEKAVRRLMDGGDEAEKIRQCAREFAKKARQAIQQGGSSLNNLSALIDDLKRLRDCKPLD